MANRTIMMLAVVMAALLATSHAADTFSSPRRSLAQAFNPTCTQARGLRNRCNELYNCLITDAKSTPAQRQQFRSMRTTMLNICNACVTATARCPTNNALPNACRAGLRFPAVSRCIQAALARG